MNTVGRRAFLAAIAVVAPAFRAGPRAQAFSVDDFLALSSRLTGYDNLDRAAAAVFLKNLLATPGNVARLTRPDAALERDIIAAWYDAAVTRPTRGCSPPICTIAIPRSPRRPSMLCGSTTAIRKTTTADNHSRGDR